jgi:hypothetical protein
MSLSLVLVMMCSRAALYEGGGVTTPSGWMTGRSMVKMLKLHKGFVFMGRSAIFYTDKGE